MTTSRAPFPEYVAPNKQQLLFPRISPLGTPQPQSSGTTKTQKSQKSVTYLPGYPNLLLNATDVSGFIQKDLGTSILEELYPHLWLVARKSSGNIDPLHQQAIKGRKIFLTEDSQLHLVWQDDRIYIKPVSLWLLNYQVWLHFLSPPPEQILVQNRDKSFLPPLLQPDGRAMALGFLRSYAYLIQHYSDFVVAHQHHLLPPTVDWISWSRFIAHFRDTNDQDVSNRYHYGQLRLSRLHWAVRLFRPRAAPTYWFYFLPHWSTTPYLQSILAPLAFAFATLSLVLSAMQVVVSLPAVDLNFSGVSDSGLQNMRRAFWIFSICLVISSGVVWFLIAIIPSGVLVWQLLWGFNHRQTVLKPSLSKA